MRHSRPFSALALLTSSLVLVCSIPLATADEVDLDTLVKRFGGDLATAQVSTETLADGIHVMRATGGAVLVTIGGDGVLLIDDQYPQTATRIQAAIHELGG